MWKIWFRLVALRLLALELYNAIIFYTDMVVCVTSFCVTIVFIECSYVCKYSYVCMYVCVRARVYVYIYIYDLLLLILFVRLSRRSVFLSLFTRMYEYSSCIRVLYYVLYFVNNPYFFFFDTYYVQNVHLYIHVLHFLYSTMFVLCTLQSIAMLVYVGRMRRRSIYF